MIGDIGDELVEEMQIGKADALEHVIPPFVGGIRGQLEDPQETTYGACLDQKTAVRFHLQWVFFSERLTFTQRSNNFWRATRRKRPLEASFAPSRRATNVRRPPRRPSSPAIPSSSSS